MLKQSRVLAIFLIAIMLMVQPAFASTPSPVISRQFNQNPNQPETTSYYKISLNQDGIYQLSYQDLQIAGLPVNSIDPRTFRILEQGVEVSIYVAGEVNGIFETGEYILFYGRKINTKYSGTNVYWLTWGGVTGKRMATSDGTPGGSGTVPTSYFMTRHIEDGNSIYQTGLPSGANKDHWYWAGINPPSLYSKDFTVNLTNLATGSITATMRGLLKGSADYANHHTQVLINNHLVDDATFSTNSDRSFTTSIPQSYLLENANTITVKDILDIGASQDLIFVNWFELDYAHTYVAENDLLFFDGEQSGTLNFRVDNFSSSSIEVFDITSLTDPQRIINGSASLNGNTYRLSFDQTITPERHYLAQTPVKRLTPLSITLDQPSDLHNTANGADWIAISYGDFINNIMPLASFRNSKGLRTAVVNVQDVYDEFSGGVFDPNAVHDFLAYAYSNWTSPAPKYVLLVGDGNYDFRNYMGYNKINYLPPFLADVDPIMGETAADNRYVVFGTSDNLPDMDLGRLPVRSTAEADAMVNKILYYEQHTPTDSWNQKLTFVADNADSGGDFAVLSDEIADHYVPSPYTVADKLYLGVAGNTTSSVQSGIINAINQGRLIISYVGHGSVGWWALEKLLQIPSISSMTNTDRFPFMVPMTCLEGYYIHPYDSGQSLSESLVRANGVGAIASFAPSGQGIASGHDILEKGLFNAIFYSKLYDLGSATTAAKQYLYNSKIGFLDLIDTYTLFGDPAMKLQMMPDPTDVDLASFTSSSTAAPGIHLQWDTLSETQTLGFNIYRAMQGGPISKINSTLIDSQKPGSLEGAHYEYQDIQAVSGQGYQYWLETLYLDQTTQMTGPISAVAPYRFNLPIIGHHTGGK